MPIYDGTQKVAPSGIQSVYDGNTKVYEKAAASPFRLLKTLPTTSYLGATCLIGGKIYIFGGYDSSTSAVSGTVYIYDIANDTLTTGGTIPTPTGGSGPIAVLGCAVAYPTTGDPKIAYLVGGSDYGSFVSGSIYTYDTSTNTFNSNPAAMGSSYYRANCNGFYSPTQVKVWFFPGTTKSPGGSLRNYITEYDPSNNSITWTYNGPDSAKNTYRMGYQGAIVSTMNNSNLMTYSVNNLHKVVSVNTGNTSNFGSYIGTISHADLNSNLTYFGVGVLPVNINNNDIYIIGGNKNTSLSTPVPSDEIYKFNTSTLVTTKLDDVLPETASYCRVETYNGEFYIIANSSIYKYTPTA